jgi:DnaJ-class molecular chaperone
MAAKIKWTSNLPKGPASRKPKTASGARASIGAALRQLKKVPCKPCNGTGVRKTTILQKCPKCAGNGWIEPKPKKEQICPRCKGDGKIEGVKEASCRVCAGKGYKVIVVQITRKEKHCPKCKGEMIPVWEKCVICKGNKQFFKICPQCGGLKTIEISCLLCKGSGVKSGRTVNCSVCSGLGMRARNVCPECDGEGTIRLGRQIINGIVESVFGPCHLCDGIGRVSKPTYCEVCLGTGKVKEKESCRRCHGSGKVRIPCFDCNQTGRILSKCGHCNNKGKTQTDQKTHVNCKTCGSTGKIIEEVETVIKK